MADGKVVIDTGLNNSGLEKDIKSLPGKMSGITSALKGIATAAAAAFSVKAIVGFGKEAVNLASDLQEVQNVVDTAFGDMAYKVEAFADSAIDQFGMSELSAKRTASTYMAMAKSMGLTEGVASDMAISLAGLTGDVASFYNISQELADVKLKSVFTGETETLKDLGIVMTQTNLKAYAMQKGISKSLESMSQAELVGLRYSYVMDNLSMAQGDFAKTSGSWANQTRILSENWKEFMSVVGQGLIQVLTPLLQILNQIITGFTGLVKGLLPSVSESVGEISSAAAGAETLSSGLESATNEAKELKKATAGFDEMTILSSGQAVSSGGGAASGGLNIPSTSFGTPDVSGVEKSANTVKGIFENLKSYLTENFAPTLSSWGAAFSGLKAPVSEAIASVSGSLSSLWNETLLPFGGYITTNFVPTLTNSFSETFAPIFGQAMPVLFSEFSKDFDFACQEINRISADILAPAFEQAKTVAVDVFDGIKKSWDEHGAGILKGFQDFKESLRKIWDTIYNNVFKIVFERIGGTISWLWEQHLKPLWDNITNFIGSVIEFLLELWNNVLAPIVDFVVVVLGPTISAVVGSIGDIIGTVIGIVSDVIGGILKSLSGLLDFLTGIFTGNWEKAWSGICDFFQGIWDAIWGIVKGVINLIIDGLNLLWGAVYGVVSGIVNGVGKIAGAIGKIFGQDWEFNMPAKPPLIPKLAQGAVIPPNREFLAVLGDQKSGRNIEAPEGLLRQLIAEELSRQQSGPVHITVKVGTTTLAKAVIDSLQDYARQNGNVPIPV